MTLPSVPTRTALRAEVDAALTEVDERLDEIEGSGGAPHTHPTGEVTGFDAAVDARAQALIDLLVGAAPGLLNTLDELAQALGDNPNFATDVATSLAGKQPLHAVLTQLAGMTLADNTVIARQGGTLGLITFAALKTALALATVATTGAYADLSGTPSIPDSPDDIGAAPSAHTHVAASVTNFDTAVDARIALVIDAAPEALNTLNEIAAALGDDPDFVGTITTLIGTKQPLNAVLTQLAAIAAADNDVIQRKAGSFTNRTPAQLKTDLSLTKADVGLSTVSDTAQVPLSLFDAAGDLIAGSGDNTAVRLAKGADGTFLGVSGGTLGYYTPGGGSPIDLIAASYGCKAITMDPADLSVGTGSGGLKFLAMASGRLYQMRAALSAGEEVSSVRVPIKALGAGAGSLWFGVYQADFSPLGSSADVAAAFTAGAAETWRTVSLTAPADTTGNFVWIVALSTLDTGPQLAFSEIDNAGEFAWLLNASGTPNAVRTEGVSALPGTLNPGAGIPYLDCLLGIA